MQEVIKMCLFSSFVQLEDVPSNLDIINKKSYKTAREVSKQRHPPITKTTSRHDREIIKTFRGKGTGGF